MARSGWLASPLPHSGLVLGLPWPRPRTRTQLSRPSNSLRKPRRRRQTDARTMPATWPNEPGACCTAPRKGLIEVTQPTSSYAWPTGRHAATKMVRRHAKVAHPVRPRATECLPMGRRAARVAVAPIQKSSGRCASKCSNSKNRSTKPKQPATTRRLTNCGRKRAG